MFTRSKILYLVAAAAVERSAIAFLVFSLVYVLSLSIYSFGAETLPFFYHIR